MDGRVTGTAIAFAFYLEPTQAREAALLAASIRTFGGAKADAPILALSTAGGPALPEACSRSLAALGCETVAFEPDLRLAGLPFAAKTAACAAAERAAASRGAGVLAWMDADTVVLREPSELLLPEGAAAGVRPVHHRLIGSPWREGPDGYWRAAYGERGLAEAYPMATTLETEPIRPYFNAGLLALRPQAGLARAWLEAAARLMALRASGGLEAEGLKLSFLHQAALAGALLRGAGAAGLYELPSSYNYPAHLHDGCPADRKPRDLDELVTLRYDRWELAPRPEGYPIPAAPSVREGLRKALAAAAW